MKALVVCLALAACAMMPKQRREETLVRQAQMFNDDLRWARYGQLRESLSGEEAQLMSARAAAIGEDLVMADYEVTGVNFATGSEAATVTVRFDWYMRRAPVLKSTTLQQRWEYTGGRWLVMKQTRVHGDRLPLVPEPAAAADRAAAAQP